MKTQNIILTTTLAAFTGLYALTGMAAPAEKKPMPEVTQWLPIDQAVVQLEAQGFSDISAIERGKHGFKVRATNANGERSWLFANGENAEVIKQWTKEDKKKWQRHANKDHKKMFNKHKHQERKEVRK